MLRRKIDWRSNTLSDWQYLEMQHLNRDHTRASVRVTAQGYRLLDELEVFIEFVDQADDTFTLPYRLSHIVPWLHAHQRLEEKWAKEREAEKEAAQ